MAFRLNRLLIPQESEALRANNFDALRLGMALLVVWSHCFALWYGTEADEWISLLLGGIYNAGNVAVLGFFTISGFLITLSYARTSSPWRYLSRRVKRIYPGYLVAITLCGLVVVPAFSSRAFLDLAPGEWLGLALNLLLRNFIPLSDAFDHGAVNGALWSIPYEFWCYLGVMALGLLGLIHRKALWVVLAVLLMVTRTLIDMDDWKPGGGLLAVIIGWPYLWLVVGPSFLLGAGVYQYRKVIPRSPWLLAGLLVATIVSAHLFKHPHVTRLLLPPTLAYATFYTAFSPLVRLHRAARFGDFSYGTYLYAYPIQQILVFTLRGHMPFVLFVPLAMLLSLFAALASWHLVERWFLRSAERKAAKHVLGDESVLVAP